MNRTICWDGLTFCDGEEALDRQALADAQGCRMDPRFSSFQIQEMAAPNPARELGQFHPARWIVLVRPSASGCLARRGSCGGPAPDRSGRVADAPECRERAVDVAERRGHRHLIRVLAPEFEHHVPREVLLKVQAHFHAVIRGRAEHLVDEQDCRNWSRCWSWNHRKCGFPYPVWPVDRVRRC